jgi:phosphatidylglycerol lysyltransferase
LRSQDDGRFDTRLWTTATRSGTGDFGPRLVAVALAVTLGSGILNLISVVGGASHPRLLVAVFPLEFSRLSRALAILVGFALIVSSLNIWKRKKRAWTVVVVLAAFSTIFHLFQARNHEEAALSFFLLLLLFLTRGLFIVKSGRPDLRSGLLRLLVSALVAVSYGITGFWLLDERHRVGMGTGKTS